MMMMMMMTTSRSWVLSICLVVLVSILSAFSSSVESFQNSNVNNNNKKNLLDKPIGQPVVFLPGYGSNPLYAVIENEASIPSSCLSQNLPINEQFLVSDNETMVKSAPKCQADLLTMTFDETTGVFADPKGIKITLKDFGKLRSIGSNYYEFFKDLLSWTIEETDDVNNNMKEKEKDGSVYVDGINLFAAPYDYRYGSPDAFDRTGYTAMLKQLVEKAYYLNNRSKVMLIGHSNGGPTMYSFLQSKQVSQEWKDKYIEGMIGLSGNYLGQMNFYSVFSYVESEMDQMFQNMSSTWEGNYGSVTYGGYEPVSDIPVITTYASQGVESEKNYTSKIGDITRLFDSIQRFDWTKRFQSAYASFMNREKHPMTNVYCLYGSQLDTSYNFVFENNMNEEYAIETLYMDGDGNQDIIDNEFCKVWDRDNDNNSSSKSGDGRYHFEAKAFPGVEHMEMVTNQDVIDYLHTILVKS